MQFLWFGLVSLFGKLFTYAGLSLAKKVAVIIAVSAAVVALAAALKTAVATALTAAAAASTVPTMLAKGIAMLPSNTDDVIAASLALETG